MEYIQKTPIEKGWSADRKYRVQLRDGKACLLRVSDLKEYDKKKREFELMEHIAALGVPMCRPVEFGICDEGVYSLLEWIDGEDAEAVIPELSEDEQYTSTALCRIDFGSFWPYISPTRRYPPSRGLYPLAKARSKR